MNWNLAEKKKKHGNRSKLNLVEKGAYISVTICSVMFTRIKLDLCFAVLLSFVPMLSCKAMFPFDVIEYWSLVKQASDNRSKGRSSQKIVFDTQPKE